MFPFDFPGRREARHVGYPHRHPRHYAIDGGLVMQTENMDGTVGQLPFIKPADLEGQRFYILSASERDRPAEGRFKARTVIDFVITRDDPESAESLDDLTCELLSLDKTGPRSRVMTKVNDRPGLAFGPVLVMRGKERTDGSAAPWIFETPTTMMERDKREKEQASLALKSKKAPSKK